LAAPEPRPFSEWLLPGTGVPDCSNQRDADYALNWITSNRPWLSTSAETFLPGRTAVIRDPHFLPRSGFFPNPKKVFMRKIHLGICLR
jgi:hypothetical protein